VDKGIEENYSIKDYHRIYIGEIVEVLKKDKKILKIQKKLKKYLLL
jgi:hypothetical protein